MQLLREVVSLFLQTQERILELQHLAGNLLLGQVLRFYRLQFLLNLNVPLFRQLLGFLSFPLQVGLELVHRALLGLHFLLQGIVC